MIISEDISPRLISYKKSRKEQYDFKKNNGATPLEKICAGVPLPLCAWDGIVSPKGSRKNKFTFLMIRFRLCLLN